MKLFAGVLMTALVLFAGAVALADIDENVFPPVGGQETIVYEWNIDLGRWDPVTDHRCEAFHVGDPISYFCNGDYVNEQTGEIEVGPWKFEVEATVAQYLEARLSKNGLAWYILKPYLFIAQTSAEIDRDWAADSIDISVKSNGDVRLDFESFDPLVSTQDPNKLIPSYWALLQADPLPPPDSAAWMTGNFSFAIDEDPAHPVLNYKLWNRLHTGKCTSACLYEDTGAIFLVLEEQKPWVAIKLDLPVQPRVDP